MPTARCSAANVASPQRLLRPHNGRGGSDDHPPGVANVGTVVPTTGTGVPTTGTGVPTTGTVVPTTETGGERQNGCGDAALGVLRLRMLHFGLLCLPRFGVERRRVGRFRNRFRLLPFPQGGHRL